MAGGATTFRRQLLLKILWARRYRGLCIVHMVRRFNLLHKDQERAAARVKHHRVFFLNRGEVEAQAIG
jgi:hypothetical protein